MSKVALYHCDSIDKIPHRLESIVDSLGRERISGLFQNKRVLLKPNVCIDHPPERGATTHPALLDAVIGIARGYGADVIVGDAPIVGVKGKAFEKAGISQVCERHGVALVDFNREEGMVITLDDAFMLNDALIAKTYFQVDTVINLPIFKSNIAYWLSGALKNMKGLLVGREKHRLHYIGIPPCVADLNRMLRQDLIIMDGFIGMMGNGPAAGKPGNARLIMGSFDPVAVDAAAAELMGFPVGKIPMISWAERAGIGSVEYEIVGDPIDSFHLEFEKPTIAKSRILGSLFQLGGRFVFRRIQRRSKVIVDLDRCTFCGVCEQACPFGAVTVERSLVCIDMNKCSLCLCCMEACAREAVQLKGLLALSDAFLRR